MTVKVLWKYKTQILTFYKHTKGHPHTEITKQNLVFKLCSSNLCKKVLNMTVPQVEHKGKHITGKFLEQSTIPS